MNKQTLTALRGSIRKWEKIADGTGVDLGPKNCPLCQLFFNGGRCQGCPVSRHTGCAQCLGTPYDDWSDMFGITGVRALKARTPKAKAAARAELAFLKSLLPKADRAARKRLTPTQP